MNKFALQNRLFVLAFNSPSIEVVITDRKVSL